MNSLESFYGGRQGASFVIVKRFDCISYDPENQDNNYKIKQCACLRQNNTLKVIRTDATPPYIERTSQNYNDYTDQLPLVCNGVTSYEAVTSGGEPADPIILPEELLESMVDCFAAGYGTTSEVNQGEYVIIDTISGAGRYNDPDNGKVFRRGLNFEEVPYNGGEYIGQIVGPKGDALELAMNSYSVAADEGSSGTYTATNGDLVPGYDGTNFHDSIDYAYKTVIDEYGKLNQYIIGFKFPYLVQDFIGEQCSPYTPEGTPLPADTPLIERIDDESHPFYSKQKIKVPHGIKGDCILDLEVFPTKVRAGATAVPIEGGASIILSSEATVAYNNSEFYDYWKETPNRKVLITYNDALYYVIDNNDNKNYFKDQHYGYLQTNYDNNRDGSSEQNDIAAYKVIKNIDVSNDGSIITVHYTEGDDEAVNTGHPIKYISSINMNSAGVVTINQNVGSPTTLDYAIKWIDNVSIDTDKYLCIEYNTDNKQDPEYKPAQVGSPINYIEESAIVEPMPALTNIPEGSVYPPVGHLIVYYAAPSSRPQPPQTQYYYNGKTGQTDLGDAKGEIGGIHIIGNVESVSALTGPPEQIMGSDDYKGQVFTVGNGENESAAIYAYDYPGEHHTSRGWYYVCDLGTDLISPEFVVDVSENAEATNGIDPALFPTKLKKNGVQFPWVSRKSAY